MLNINTQLDASNASYAINRVIAKLNLIITSEALCDVFRSLYNRAFEASKSTITEDRARLSADFLRVSIELPGLIHALTDFSDEKTIGSHNIFNTQAEAERIGGAIKSIIGDELFSTEITPRVEELQSLYDMLLQLRDIAFIALDPMIDDARDIDSAEFLSIINELPLTIKALLGLTHEEIAATSTVEATDFDLRENANIKFFNEIKRFIPPAILSDILVEINIQEAEATEDLEDATETIAASAGAGISLAGLAKSLPADSAEGE